MSNLEANVPMNEEEYKRWTGQSLETIHARMLLAVLSQKPEELERFTPEELIILIEGSGLSGPDIGFGDLATRFGLEIDDVIGFYYDSIASLWANTNESLAEDFPITEMFKTPLLSTDRAKLRNGELLIGRSTQTTPDTEMKRETRKKRGNAPGAYVIDRDDLSGWREAEREGLISIIRAQGLMTPEEMADLDDYFSGRHRSDDIKKTLNKFSLVIVKLV